MQCKYHKGRNIPPQNTQFRHMVLLWSWIPVHCLNLYQLCEIHNSTLILRCGTQYSILWIWCSTMWNVKNSTLVPHKILSICFITDIPHNFHTNSTFWFHTITTLILHLTSVPYRGKGKKLWNSTSMVFPHLSHTLNTLWNRLVFSSALKFGDFS